MPKKRKLVEQNYWKRLWTVNRWIKAFLFACTVGLGYYLGNLFFGVNWILGLILTTIFMAFLGGNLLDVLFPER